MTKAEALYKFWSGFGLPAYEENSVPVNAGFPYITYQIVTGGTAFMTASIWDRDRDGHSALLANDKKTDAISRFIGLGGMMIPYDGGGMWICKNSPFAQVMGDPSDGSIKRSLLQIVTYYISED